VSTVLRLALLFALYVSAGTGFAADSPGMGAAPLRQSPAGASSAPPGNSSSQAPRAPMAPRAPNAPAYHGNNNARGAAPEQPLQEPPSLEQQRRQRGSEMESQRKR
jgi:hypothetical protein